MKRAVLILIACFALASPAASQKSGGTLTIWLNSDIRSVEPGINRDSNTDTLINVIFEGLVAYRADLTVAPALASSWTISDEGKTYTFRLREGARFQNGAPVTSAEVKWSWERLMSQPGWACKRAFDGTSGLKVVAVETPDPMTVIYRLNAPQALFLKQLANLQCHALVFHPSSVDAEGKFVTPIGTGPYKLKEWKRGDYIELERSAYYKPSDEQKSGFAGAKIAYMDRVIFRVIPDTNAAAAALMTGAIDIMPAVESNRVEDLTKSGMKIQQAQGLNWAPLLIQTRDPLLSNVKIRQAMAYAIDIDQVAEARTDGLAEGNPSAVSQGSAYFDKKFLDWPKYDPERARALLKEAGYKGQVIKIQTNKRYTPMYECAVIVQAMLVSAGFNAEIETLDWATQMDNYLNGNFQLQTFIFSARLDPGLMYAGLIADKDKMKWAQWDDPKAMALLAESARTDDEARRKEIFLELQKMIVEQVPIIGFYFVPIIDGVRPNVHGYQTWAAGHPVPWGVWKD